METQDKQNSKKKAFAISTLMGNPKLAETIYESFSAPVGSTKNQKAKSILYSMKRANNIHDGAGGIGDWWKSNVVDPLQDVGRGIKSRVGDISGRIQEPPGAQRLAEEGDVGITKFVRGVDDLVSWAGSPTPTEGKSRLETGAEWAGKKVAGIPKPVGEAIGFVEKDVMYPWMSMASTAGQNILSYPYRAGKYLTDPTRGAFEKGKEYEWAPFRGAGEEIVKDVGVESTKNYYQIEGSPHVYEKGTNRYITESEAKEKDIWKSIETLGADKVVTPDFIGPLVAGQIRDPKSQRNSNNVYRQMILSGQDPKTAEYEAKWQTGHSPDVDAINKELAQDPISNPEFGKGTIDEMTPEDRETFFNSLDNSEQDFWRESYEASNIFDLAESAYELGLGSKTFAWTLLQDKEKLAAALGIPKEQAASLPEGLLSEQLNDLRDSVDKKYKIEDQLDKLFDLQQRDLTIEDDFKSYIRGKDEYLGDIDKLLDGAETKIANMDTSNPYVAQRMQMYVNYLTILQGRQNKRYIDFLDSGITKHKNDMDSATNVYNRSIEQANKEYQEIGTVTAESYNMMKTMLEDIYNNIESREDRQIKLDEWETKKSDAVLDSAYKMLRNQKIEAEIYGVGVNKEVNASTAKMFRDMYSRGENDDGTINFSIYDPGSIRNSASLAGQNEDYAVNAFMDDMGYTVFKSTENGSLNQFERFKKSMVQDLGSKIVDVDKLTEAEQAEYNKFSEEEKAIFEASNNENLNDFVRMHTKLQKNVQEGIKDYFSSTEDKIKELRMAIDDLGKKEGGWFGWGKISRENFMKSHGGPLGDYANILFNVTEDTLRNYPSKKSKDVWGDIPDEALSGVVSEELAKYLML
jgi:hypothetical protein